MGEILRGGFEQSSAWDDLASKASGNSLVLMARFIPGMNDGLTEIRVTENSGRGNAFVEFGATLQEAACNVLAEWGHRWEE